MINSGKLAGRTVFITGGSRGIGKAIAIKIAKDGANVVVAAKTAKPHSKLAGTIYTTVEEVEAAGGKGLACIVDVRDEQQVKSAVEAAVAKFGGIDILVNNASAISLTDTLGTEMKRYDLMHNINTRGTFLVSKECIPYLKKSSHAHILNLSPPLSMNPIWFKSHVAYTMAKYGMSMCVLGMHEELRSYNIGVNALWPRTAIYTAAMEMLTGAESAKYCRKPDIMADAAYVILSSDPKTTTGNFFVDDVVLKEAGIQDMDQYAYDPTADFMPDLFLDENLTSLNKNTPKFEPPSKSKDDASTTKIRALFTVIESNLNEDLVQKTQAAYQFEVLGDQNSSWFVDLKTTGGKCGRGTVANPDATLTMECNNFLDMFAGKLKPAGAFMTGKLKIKGNMQSAMKLEKLMKGLKSKL